MANIILYLLKQNQQLILTINYLLLFIAKYIPLKQFIHDDSVSPEYQKFKVDQLPIIKKFEKQDYTFLLEYYLWKYGKTLKPVQIRKNSKRNVPEDSVCPVCGAPHQYLYDNNGGNGQYQCKVCGHTFINGKKSNCSLGFICPYCGLALILRTKRENLLIFTNVLIPSAHITRLILKNYLKIYLTVKNINTNFITSIVNLQWILFLWIYTTSLNCVITLKILSSEKTMLILWVYV